MKKLLTLFCFFCIVNLTRAQDTTFFIGAWVYPNGCGSPGNGYGSGSWYEPPDSAKAHGFNAVWVWQYTPTQQQFFQEAAACSMKVYLGAVRDTITGLTLNMIGAGHSSIYECEVDSSDADNDKTAPTYYYVNCSSGVSDTCVFGASDSVGFGIAKNAKYVEPGQALPGRVINGVKARYPGYKDIYPCRDPSIDRWFNRDIKEQEIPQCGNTVNFGAQKSLPYYATFRLMRLDDTLPSSTVVCTLHVEVIDDSSGSLLPIYIHTVDGVPH
ncbi:MAG: hypothetical protein ACYDEQ_05480, partial [Desulfocucumaceae bacterium]